jgi:hypothetical protein
LRKGAAEGARRVGRGARLRALRVGRARLERVGDRVLRVARREGPAGLADRPGRRSALQALAGDEWPGSRSCDTAG